MGSRCMCAPQRSTTFITLPMIETLEPLNLDQQCSISQGAELNPTCDSPPLEQLPRKEESVPQVDLSFEEEKVTPQQRVEQIPSLNSELYMLSRSPMQFASIQLFRSSLSRCPTPTPKGVSITNISLQSSQYEQEPSQCGIKSILINNQARRKRRTNLSDTFEKTVRFDN